MGRKGVQFCVHGRVQGVWFRATTQRMANQLDIVGWVENRSDGTVAGEAAGLEEQLNQFVAYLRRGPTRALVEKLELNWCDVPKYHQFEIRG